MRLVGLKLRNIRSYQELDLKFDKGITLLSGDIGCGKSTILLGIEFGLFGLSRGELTGNALLRHGKSDGDVIVSFECDSTIYSIKRTLKKTKATVQQDTGWLETNGVRESLTASELRARIFEILGYPLQFLSKQKNILYRFTIYTPQEDMKAILFQSVDERIETIRRIFGIDSYKTIRDNAAHTVRAMKSKEQTNEEVSQLLKANIDASREKLASMSDLKERELTMKEEAMKASALLKLTEEQGISLEEQLAQVQQKLQTIAIRKRDKKILEQDIERGELQLSQRKKRVEDGEKTILSMKEKIIELEKIVLTPANEISEVIQRTRLEIESATQERGKLLAIKEQCTHIPGVDADTKCPTCHQQVSNEHLEKVLTELNAKSQAAERKLAKLDENMAKLRLILDKNSNSLLHAQELASLNDRLAMQEKTHKGHIEDLNDLQQALSSRKKELSEHPPVEADKESETRYKEVQESIRRNKTETNSARSSLMIIEKELSAIEERRKQSDDLKREIKNKEEELKKLESQKRVLIVKRDWLQEKFTPLTLTIEQNVLKSIHGAFDSSFRAWFDRLIEDDALQSRLDSEFTPIIQQNGYENELNNLSGGERTSISLAYRLALVHTIHSLLPHLGTTGLVILDEPTDGFSSDQLSRMRDVLRELAMEQVILVSHEPQLESFVDNIVRVRKSSAGSYVET